MTPRSQARQGRNPAREGWESPGFIHGEDVNMGQYHIKQARHKKWKHFAPIFATT